MHERNSKILVLKPTTSAQKFTWRNNVRIKSITISKVYDSVVSGYFNGMFAYSGTDATEIQGFVLAKGATFGIFNVSQIVNSVNYVASEMEGIVTIEFEELM